MAVSFVNQDITFKLKEKIKLKKWIKTIIELNSKQLGEVSYAFCSDAYILETNNHFLGHNYFTDIITFDYCKDLIIEGDILISIDTVLDNAKTYNVDFDNELHRVIIHGILHLIGFDDKTKEQQAEMRLQEDKALNLLSTL